MAEQKEMVAPTIETDRLRLRTWRLTDVAPYARICSEPDVMRYMHPPRALTAMEVGLDVERLREHWLRWGFGHWAVEELETGRLVGRTGIKRHPDWPLDPENTEVGWLYAKDTWGKGYATEAGRVVVDFAFQALGRPEVISIAHPDNAGSRRVMEKLGLSLAGEMHWAARRMDVVWYAGGPGSAE